MKIYGLHRGTINSGLTQSDSASRKRPFSTGLVFDWIILVLIVVVVVVVFTSTRIIKSVVTGQAPVYRQLSCESIL